MAGRIDEVAGKREAFWREHMGRWEESGQSIRGYCRAQGLSEPGFHFWKRELKRRAMRGAWEPSGPTFAEVRIGAPEAGLIEIVLSESRRIQVHAGFDEETLLRVLAVLGRAAC